MEHETSSAPDLAPLPEPTLQVVQEPPRWENADDAALLSWRISDLKVRIAGSVVEQRIARLYAELEAKGLCFRPPCYLATEWLCPDRVPAIGIPFYLAHPRLQRLEKTMMLEAEGETESECMKLLRHETGHAINYAYRLYRRSHWRKLFGPISKEYRAHEYHMRPYSRQYVVHLQDNYAQAHPDEDFTETFAVWLTPDIDWRQRYREWGALKKLEYVDHLMKEISQKQPLVADGPRLWSAARTRATLETYFKNKRREFAKAYTGFYDPLLRRLFSDAPSPDRVKAVHFLNKNRKTLTDAISQWARVPKYAGDHLVRRLAQRSRDMNLYLRTDEKDALFPVGICLTSLVFEARDLYIHRMEKREQT